ncbi:MAG TPA: NUDIX hydrolase [Nitrososphaerales archaeon]|nr:NUDIX hydrolase [Nitrososphaerales archaeon]
MEGLVTTDRRFAAFSKDALPPRMNTVPEGGMCISAFLVISKRGEPGSVLMGRINKNAEWDHIGALNGKRLERFASGWMLPSSHLILYETPEGAARRILREQLGIRNLKLQGPTTFADTSTARFSGTPNHWDIGFIFTAERENAPSSEAWDELKFVDGLRPDDIVRSQVDVLAYVGRLNPN